MNNKKASSTYAIQILGVFVVVLAMSGAYFDYYLFDDTFKDGNIFNPDRDQKEVSGGILGAFDAVGEFMGIIWDMLTFDFASDVPSYIAWFVGGIFMIAIITGIIGIFKIG